MSLFNILYWANKWGDVQKAIYTNNVVSALQKLPQKEEGQPSVSNGQATCQYYPLIIRYVVEAMKRRTQYVAVGYFKRELNIFHKMLDI